MKPALYITLAALYLSFVPSGNEWHYMGLAKHWVDPSWSPHTFLFEDGASHRLVWQAVFGTLLTVFSWEQVAFLGNLTIILLIVQPLSRLYETTGQALLHIAFFLYVGQTFLGQENMLLGFEARHFAYVLALWAYLHLEGGKYGKAMLCVAGATVIHIGVGIFLFPIYLIYSRKYALYYVLLVAVLYTQMSANVDAFYSQVRQAHHTLAGADIKTMLPLAFFVPFAIFYRNNNRKLLMLAYVLVLTILSLIDNVGIVDKYFPTRIASFVLFILLVPVAKLVKGVYLPVTTAIALLLPPIGENIINMYRHANDPVYETIRQLPPDAVILDLRTDPLGFDLDYDLEHKTGRQVYFNFKYVNLGHFPEWKRRYEKVKAKDYSEVNYIIR